MCRYRLTSAVTRRPVRPSLGLNAQSVQLMRGMHPRGSRTALHRTNSTKRIPNHSNAIGNHSCEMMYQDSVVRDFNWPFAMAFGISGKDDANDWSVLSIIKVSLCCWSSRCLRGAHPLRLFGCSLVRRRSWPMPPICSSPHINSRENLARSHRIGIKIRGRSRAAVRHHRAQSLRLSKQTPGGPDSRGRASFDDAYLLVRQ